MGLAIVGAISIIALLAVVPSWIQKWLWMRQLGYARVFWTLLSVRWELSCTAFVVTLLYLWINLRLAARNGGTFRVEGLDMRLLTRTYAILVMSREGPAKIVPVTHRFPVLG